MRIAAVTVAIAVAVVVGATRVYLRAHYLTDVLGGAGLSLAIWSLVGALALVAAAEPPLDEDELDELLGEIHRQSPTASLVLWEEWLSPPPE